MSVESNWCQHVNLDMLTDLYSVEIVMDILHSEPVTEERERRLNLATMVYVLIGWGLFTHLSLRDVLGQVTHGLRLLWPMPSARLPVPSALSYRRQQLGILPMEALMRRCCRPLADEESKGAFRFGLRLMALDSTTEALADTDQLERAFGRRSGRRGSSAFPQLQGTYLLECGTHAIIDALFLPCHVNERHPAKVLLRSLSPGMLLQWDTGFHEFDLLRLARRTGAHVLGRLPAGPCPHKIKQLSDGSWLVEIQPGEIKRRRRGEKMLLRLIEYTLTDERLVGCGQTHRLLTTLLDEQLAPAMELVCCYHERWEIEISIDEVDTHQRAQAPVLRSRTVAGVYQELYGLLLAHYLIRKLMWQTARERDLDPDRLSFTHAIQILRQYLPSLQMLSPEHWPALQARMRQEMAEGRLPQRRLRINPRVVKRPTSPFERKRPEHLAPRFRKDELFHHFVLLI
jgi:hypothetical protein